MGSQGSRANIHVRIGNWSCWDRRAYSLLYISLQRGPKLSSLYHSLYVFTRIRRLKYRSDPIQSQKSPETCDKLGDARSTRLRISRPHSSDLPSTVEDEVRRTAIIDLIRTCIRILRILGTCCRCRDLVLVLLRSLRSSLCAGCRRFLLMG